MTMSAILADIGTIVTSSFTWATQAVNFIVGQPIILLCVLFTFVGYGVHLVKMLMHR